MKKNLAIFAVSLVIGALAYFVTNRIYLEVIFCFLTFFSLLLFVLPLFKKTEELSQKRKGAYRFINAFSVSLSVTHSPEVAFDAASASFSPSEKAIEAQLEKMSLEEKLEYLSRYFDVTFFKVFTSIYHVYEEQGGDVLTLFGPILHEAFLAEESGEALEKIRIRNLSQYVILWTLSFLILAFIRYGLSSFYSSLEKSWVYLLLACSYFVFAIVSFCLYAVRFSKQKLERKAKNV